MTGRDLVSASLRLIGALAPGESLNASEATDGLAAINRMVDSWSNESLLIYAKVRDQFTLVPGTQSYTFGTGGVFNSSRPMEIEEARLLIDTSSPAIEYPIRILNVHEWASIVQKTMTSAIPTDLYAEGTYPLETINIYPNPTLAYKIVLFSSKQISQIATLDTTLSLPPGYERALVFNGAVDLSSEYGRPVSPEVAAIAMESKAAIKRKNVNPAYLRVDNALSSRGHFNIYKGESS